MSQRIRPFPNRPSRARGARLWGCRLAPLWLVLVAFLGHTAMPLGVWGSLNPRESEQESDTLEEVWKWAAASESRSTAHGRTKRRTGLPCVPPQKWTVGQREQMAARRSATQSERGEWAERNGLGGPLRC